MPNFSPGFKRCSQTNNHAGMQTATFIIQTSLFTRTVTKIITLVIHKASYEESCTTCQINFVFANHGLIN